MTRTDSTRSRASEFREAQARSARRRRLGIIAIIVVAALLLAAIAGVIAVALGSAPQMGAEGMPIEQGTVLAPDTTSAAGSTEDGVPCATTEQLNYHIHTHLAVYVNGVLRPIPGGIGIVQPTDPQHSSPAFYGATRCYYWLHVHTQDGVIHVESPTTSTYTLGQFFAVWGQPLSASRVAGATGPVAAFVNGERVTGDPSAISLGSRESIQLDVGSVEPWHPVDWSGSQL